MNKIINLVVCRLNVYVGKERMLVFPVVISVAMTQKAVATVVRGNRDPNKQFSPCLQAHKLLILNFMMYVGDILINIYHNIYM